MSNPYDPNGQFNPQAPGGPPSEPANPSWQGGYGTPSQASGGYGGGYGQPAPGYAPQSGYPSSGGYPPQGGAPEPGQAPPSGYPQQPGFPQTGYPSQGYPGYPGAQAYGVPPTPKKKNTLPIILGSIGGVVALCCVLSVIGLALLSRTPSGTNGHITGATATPTPQIIYQDTLTSANNDWLDNTQCGFKADGYHITDAVICYSGAPDTTADADVTVNVKQVSGAADGFYGFVFRRPSKGNYYSFQIDSSGEWAFYKEVNSSTKLIVSPQTSAAIHTGLNAANSLEIRMTGTHFAFFANGTQLGQADDTTFTSGMIGLEGDSNIDVAFTNFLVTKPA
jgi:hypothetical protein